MLRTLEDSALTSEAVARDGSRGFWVLSSVSRWKAVFSMYLLLGM